MDVLKTLGASNLSKAERSELDFYATDPRTIKALLDAEKFDEYIWEPGSGTGNIVNVLKDYGYNVWSTDIHDYGCQDNIIDFLDFYDHWNGDIIGNPPYKLATEFVEKALSLVEDGHKVVMLLRLQFLEGQKRYTNIFSKGGLEKVWCFVNRQVCVTDNNFNAGSAIAYAWFQFKKGYKGKPTIEWLMTKKN